MTGKAAALMLAAVTALAAPAHAAAPGQAEAERFIRVCEAARTRSSGPNDTRAVAPCLAADYEGHGTAGSVAGKAKVLAKLPAPALASNDLRDVSVRFFGDTAVARGTVHWTKASGERGRRVWTDIWVKRVGRWAIVASQHNAVPPLTMG